jgi:hypothetical protein
VTNQVRAGDLRTGDTIVRDDREMTIERIWSGGKRYGLIIYWESGSASGVFDIQPCETVTRMRNAGGPAADVDDVTGGTR